MRFPFVGLLFAVTCASAALAAQTFTGTYRARSNDGVVTLKVVQSANGTVSGTLSRDGEATRFSGRADGGEISGATIPDDPTERAELHMHFEGGRLIVEAIA